MNIKIVGIILAAVFLFEFAAAKRIRHYETITGPNGERIEHSWSTDEADETELNKNKNSAPNISEDTKDGADENYMITSGVGKHGYHQRRTNFERDFDREQNRKELLDFALNINSFFQPRDDFNEPRQMIPKLHLPDTFRHTQRVSSSPRHYSTTDIYSGPRTVFTGNWPDLLAARPIQQDWQERPNPVGNERTTPRSEHNNNNPIPNAAMQSTYH